MTSQGSPPRRVLSCLQLKEEEARIEEDEADTRKRMKETREHSKKWEENREGRVRRRPLSPPILSLPRQAVPCVYIPPILELQLCNSKCVMLGLFLCLPEY